MHKHTLVLLLAPTPPEHAGRASSFLRARPPSASAPAVGAPRGASGPARPGPAHGAPGPTDKY
eukprot:4875650-Pyramimonas_sp.AAC.1